MNPKHNTKVPTREILSPTLWWWRANAKDLSTSTTNAWCQAQTLISKTLRIIFLSVLQGSFRKTTTIDFKWYITRCNIVGKSRGPILQLLWLTPKKSYISKTTFRGRCCDCLQEQWVVWQNLLKRLSQIIMLLLKILKPAFRNLQCIHTLYKCRHQFMEDFSNHFLYSFFQQFDSNSK